MAIFFTEICACAPLMSSRSAKPNERVMNSVMIAVGKHVKVKMTVTIVMRRIYKNLFLELIFLPRSGANVEIAYQCSPEKECKCCWELENINYFELQGKNATYFQSKYI